MGDLALVGVVGAFAQFVDGALGMGFGVSSASLLAFLGFAPAVVSASVHVSKIACGLASGAAHLGFGNVDRRAAGVLAAAGSAGASIGAIALLVIAASATRPAVALVLVLLGIRLFCKFYRRAGCAGVAREVEPASTNGRVPTARLVGVGLVGGIIDAVGGGGWGPVCTPALAADDRIEPRTAIGSVNLAEVAVAVTVVTILGAGMGWSGIPWGVVVTLIAGGVVAAPLAAWMCSRLPVSALGMAIGAVLVALNVRTLLGALPPFHVSVNIAVRDLWIPLALGLVAVVAARWFQSRSLRRAVPAEAHGAGPANSR